MRKLVAISVIALALPVVAQDKPKEIPSLTVEQREQFFKSQSLLNQAQLALEHTAEFQTQQTRAREFQKQLVDLQAVCGKDYQLALNKEGDPFCQEKPKETKPTSQAPGTPQPKK